MKILLKNGRVADYINSIDKTADMLISDGFIREIGNINDKNADKIIDCTGFVVIPGIFDMHVHLRDPGQTYKEDIFTGCEAAAAGGVTGILAMPNTVPALDSPERIKYIAEKAKNAKARVYSVCSITKGLSGGELCDFTALKEAGAIAVSDDGRPVKNARMMAKAMKKAEETDMLAISHCEDLDIIDGGIINQGKISEELGVKGMHRASENLITEREIGLARDYNTKIHIAHVSTKEAVAAIKAAKANGIKVTCETAPHYFTLTEDELKKRDADYRMNPPLRERSDANAIREALKDGTIDVIVTDHAPHSPDEKADFFTAPNGVIGLETSLAVTLTELYHKNKFSLHDIIKLMCVNPRKILGLDCGELKIGNKADIAVVDLNEEWIVNPDKMCSKSKNTCFKGMKLKGRVRCTLLGGKIVWEV